MKKPRREEDALERFPRGFLDFLTPTEDIQASILSLDEMAALSYARQQTQGAIEVCGIPFYIEHETIRCRVALGRNDGYYGAIDQWVASLVTIINLFFVYAIVERKRRWKHFVLDISHFNGRRYEYSFTYKTFEAHYEESEESQGASVPVVSFRDAKGRARHAEVPLIEWLYQLDPVIISEPREVQNASDETRARRKDAMLDRVETSVRHAIVSSLIEAGFISERKCEKCDAHGWPIFRLKVGHPPLSARMCTRCEDLHRRARKAGRK